MPPGKNADTYPGLRPPASFFLLPFSPPSSSNAITPHASVRNDSLRPSPGKSTIGTGNVTVIFDRRCETRDYFRTGGSVISPRATKCQSSSISRLAAHRDAWACSRFPRVNFEGNNSAGCRRRLRHSFFALPPALFFFFFQPFSFRFFPRKTEGRFPFFPTNFRGTAVGINNTSGIQKFVKPSNPREDYRRVSYKLVTGNRIEDTVIYTEQ